MPHPTDMVLKSDLVRLFINDDGALMLIKIFDGASSRLFEGPWNYGDLLKSTPIGFDIVEGVKISKVKLIAAVATSGL